jgi:hypothetical protein
MEKALNLHLYGISADWVEDDGCLEFLITSRNRYGSLRKFIPESLIFKSCCKWDSSQIRRVTNWKKNFFLWHLLRFIIYLLHRGEKNSQMVSNILVIILMYIKTRTKSSYFLLLIVKWINKFERNWLDILGESLIQTKNCTFFFSLVFEHKSGFCTIRFELRFNSQEIKCFNFFVFVCF